MTNRITETIGVDLGDRYSAYCVVDEASGEVLNEGRIRTTPKGFHVRFHDGDKHLPVLRLVG